MAITLEGNWKSGKAFDLHTVSSTHLGVDEHGHDRFDNSRSEMGELVYQLKYRNDRAVLTKIVQLLDDIQGIEKFDFLIPIPPTKKNRAYQPVELIASALGDRRSVPVLLDALRNDGAEELKGVSDPVARLELLEAAIKLDRPERLKGLRVLLIDDLYRSGSTFRVATKLLYAEGGVQQVSALAMTKTRSNR